MVKAAGITAGTLLIAIGLAAQFGGAALFHAPRHVRPVSHAAAVHSTRPAGGAGELAPSQPPAVNPGGGGEDSDGGG